MLKEIKNKLIENPETIKNVLEHFDFHNIILHDKYISFGRSPDSSRKSIVIRIDDNPYLYVKDYARNISQDIFNYIIQQRKVSFIDVLNYIKTVLGIEDYYDFFENKGIFGGFYDRIRKRTKNTLQTYDNSILNKYISAGNLRFLRDHISLSTQKIFGIRYDVESQGIVIPIYTQTGELMGIKVRRNSETTEDELKYFYLLPCLMSQTLYGYAQNYSYLENNIVFIFEAEKSVMQCHSYGFRNCVALGSGSISSKQVQMIMELNPKKVIFMHDTGYEFEYIERNIQMLQHYSLFAEFEIGYWDFTDKGYADKQSATDLGKDEFNRIIQNEIKYVERTI